MPRYRIVNRVTKEQAEVEAPYAQTACEWLGWPIAICYVQLLREGPFSDLGPVQTRTHLGHRGEEGDRQEEELPF